MDSINIDERVVVPSGAIHFAAVRASGPGGQNVNKVSSKVELRVDLSAITGLLPDAKERLSVLAAPRLDAEGLLLITSQKTRDQVRNLADAIAKVRAMIETAMVAPIPRKKTKPSRGAVKRRLETKRRTSDRKANRGRVSDG
jgi:ribosome-associated protein